RFDHDPYPDLATVEACGDVTCSSGGADIYRGDGTGGFQAPTHSSIPIYYPGAAVAGDFDADGRDGIGIGTIYGPASPLHCRVNDGMALEGCQGVGAASLGYTATVVDVDRDGHLDIVTGGGYLSGRGDGTFNAFVFVTTGNGAIVAGDFNGDGWPDL